MSALFNINYAKSKQIWCMQIYATHPCSWMDGYSMYLSLNWFYLSGTQFIIGITASSFIIIMEL